MKNRCGQRPHKIPLKPFFWRKYQRHRTREPVRSRESVKRSIRRTRFFCLGLFIGVRSHLGTVQTICTNLERFPATTDAEVLFSISDYRKCVALCSVMGIEVTRSTTLLFSQKTFVALAHSLSGGEVGADAFLRSAYRM